jgi:outer membrane protein assembly factor BamB
MVGTPDAPTSTLSAYAARTRELRWSVQVAHQTYATLVTDHAILLGESTGQPNYEPSSFQVVALAADGKMLWTYQVPYSLENARFPFIALATLNTTVYVLDGSTVQTCCFLAALDVATGQPAWQKEIVEGGSSLLVDGQSASTLSQGKNPPPIPGDGVALNTINALSITGGEQRWRVETQTTLHLIATDGQALYLQASTYNKDADTTKDQVLTVRAADGQELWSVSVDSPNLLTLTNGVLFTTLAGDTQGARHALALNSSDGSQRWQTPLPGFSSGLLATSDTVYFGCGGTSNSIVALNTNDGSQRWTITYRGKDRTTCSSGKRLIRPLLCVPALPSRCQEGSAGFSAHPFLCYTLPCDP